MDETEKDEDVRSSGPLAIGSDSNSVDSNPNSVQGMVRRTIRRSSKSNWTEEEDKILEAAVQRFNGKCWKKIAECIPDRSDVQCLHRWQKVIHPGLVKGPWTKEEDELIMKLVEKQGNKKWAEIAKHLPGRIGKQCRERWYNHLNPEINRSAWTKEEESNLIKAHAVYGNKWAEIAKFLHGRTENSIKNHWNCSLKKKMDPPSARGSAFNHHGIAQYSTSGSALSNHGFARYSTHGSAFSRVATDAGGKNSEVLKLAERGAGPCLNLVLGNSIGREGHHQPLKNENIRIPRDQANYIMKPPSLTCQVVGGQGVNKTAKSWGKQDHMIAMQLNGPCTTLPTDHTRSPCLHRNSHKPDDLINPSLLRPPHKHLLPSLNSTLNKNDHGPHSQVANTCTKKRLFNDCEGTSRNKISKSNLQEKNEIPKNCLDIAESNFSSHSNSSCSFLLTPGGSDESSTTGVDKTTLFKNTVGGLCYKPLEKEDCDVFLSTGEFPSTDSFLRVPITPVSVDSSMSDKKRGPVDFSSSESILRNAAVSFKNIPSIIRKRCRLSSKQAGNTNQKDGVCSPEKVTNSSNNRPEFPRECPNAKQFCLSPPKPQKLEDLADSKYAGKLVDYASGDVSDSRNANTNTKAAADTSGGCCDLANYPGISGL